MKIAMSRFIILVFVFIKFNISISAQQSIMENWRPELWENYLREMTPGFLRESKYFKSGGFGSNSGYPSVEQGFQPTLKKGAHILSDGVQVEWINNYMSNLVPSQDRVSDLAVDKEGNLFITGKSFTSPTYLDIATIKYSPNGEVQWIARYNGDGGDGDESEAITVDSHGNVYVTGMSTGSDSEGDYITIKYDPQGQEQWVASYNGPGNDFDRATAIDVDAFGNVYVTGNSRSLESGYDCATLKYSASGVEEWVVRYSGPGVKHDGATDITLDNNGNVYIVGRTERSSGNVDYLTIKYDSTGDEKWVTRYDGIDNRYDDARALAVDVSGNVYVTGGSNNLGASADYATIKYNADGVLQWIATYDGPASSNDGANSIALDERGSVYVTGGSEGIGSYKDYATIKYNSGGNEEWVRRYNGPSNHDDYASEITIGKTGNIYVTGTSSGMTYSDFCATIMYDSLGDEVWVARCDSFEADLNYVISNAISVDDSGNVYIAGSSYEYGVGGDFVSVKYDSSGNKLWDAVYDGPGVSYDVPFEIALDTSGSVYVAGGSYSIDTHTDFAILKYLHDGTELWVTRYNGPGNSGDGFKDMAVDDLGNVYIAGQSWIFPMMKWVVAKYNTEGVEQWVVTHEEPDSSSGSASAVALDKDGFIFVTGYYNDEFMTIKYDAAGMELWVSKYGELEGTPGVARAIALDSDGKVHVTGYCFYPDTRNDITTIKYDQDGAEEWTARYDGSYDYDDPKDIYVDDSGFVYVLGHSDGTGTSTDYATIKYDSNGAEIWVSRYNGFGNSGDEPAALAVDGSGNIYVTGRTDYSDSSGSKGDYATVKYNASGVEQWVALFHGSGERFNYATDISTDTQGNIYVTGGSESTRLDYDIATVKYSADGEEMWVATYAGAGNTGDWPLALEVDTSFNVYLTGGSSKYGTSIYTTIKYSQTIVSVKNEIPLSDLKYSLSQCYPNPFNLRTTIQYELPTTSNISLIIYNLMGQEVIRWEESNILPGYHKKTWNGINKYGEQVASGIYFYRLQAGAFIQIRKMLLLK